MARTLQKPLPAEPKPAPKPELVTRTSPEAVLFFLKHTALEEPTRTLRRYEIRVGNVLTTTVQIITADLYHAAALKDSASTKEVPGLYPIEWSTRAAA